MLIDQSEGKEERAGKKMTSALQIGSGHVQWPLHYHHYPSTFVLDISCLALVQTKPLGKDASFRTIPAYSKAEI